ncbi:MAG TPA: hypothetical protein RMH99_26000 [Sandaracinaceae bacterium LLY-WYZ-13_1]|nr:hypothetical protein [Sandaracinaceae bacterium LLY-WYZ-13_1]
MRSSPWLGAAIAGLLIALASPAHATISEALSLPELVAEADHVVLVTCVDERTSRDARRRIVTDFTLRVEEAMKGGARPGSTLTMRRLGGALGDLGMRVEGEPHLEVGRRYLVFLRTLTDGTTLRPVGMSQGVMPVQEEAGARMVQPGGGGMALMQRGSDGRLRPAPAALLHPRPYVDVRGRVERLVADGTGGAVAP